MFSKTDKSVDTESQERADCSAKMEYALLNNIPAQKVLESIESLGCKLPKDFFVCRPCEADIAGGFSVKDHSDTTVPYVPQVVMCQNKKLDQSTFNSTLVHELIHAYDACRAKLDFMSCQQHTCTEIRAAALSGECDLIPEAMRGNFIFYKGHQECVKRRAALSTSYNPNCKGMSKEVVDSIFDKCYHDTKPFEKSLDFNV